MLGLIAEICIALGTDGLRGELTLIKSARAEAAWSGDLQVSEKHILKMAPSALGHRLRRNPLDDSKESLAGCLSCYRNDSVDGFRWY